MKFVGTLVSLLTLLNGALAANNFGGLTVSNAAGGTGSYNCRTPAQWIKLANDAKGAGFKAIRIVGFDCDALNGASTAAASVGLQVIAGIYFDKTVAASNSDIDTQVGQFITAAEHFGANRYIGLGIGNENDADSPTNLMNKVSQVRSRLQLAGINTPVTTVHTWIKIRDNPVLCQGDFVGANAHAFYDPNTVAGQAGNFVMHTAVPALKQACPGKRIIITESGWASGGPPIGKAVASVANENSALHSLNCAIPSDSSVSVFAFEYDDQLWKGNDNERSFGIFGKLDLGSVTGAC